MEDQKRFIDDLIEEYGDTVTSKQILDFAESKGMPVPYFLLRDEKKKIGRGKYRLCTRASLLKRGTVSHAIADALDKSDAQEMAPQMVAPVVNLASRRAMNVTESFIPDKLDTYVPFGFYNDLRNILVSKQFYPVYITGLSGNGKTLMVEQVAAAIGRELIRVNITKRTDETDLIGSYELIDGNTVRREGPVITAMRRGAILLLDETDYGTEDLLCLNGILEGKPYFDKKTGEVIHAAYGFTVIATANTKGKGDSEGRFIGANVLNEAFLERFAITVEQEYPDSKTEKKILSKNFAKLGVSDDQFIDRLVTWAEVIRKSFLEGAVDELISTRRLVHIAKAFAIFKDRMKAIELCLSRFDAETKIAFTDLYTKVDADAMGKSELPEDADLSDVAKALTDEYGQEVKIYRDEKDDTIVVSSHGRETKITRVQVKQAANVTSILKDTVDRHNFLS
jgi:MoxR-like ATPase